MGAGLLAAIVGEDPLRQAREADALEIAGRNDPIGIDIVANHGHPTAAMAGNRTNGKGRNTHGVQEISGRTSVT
jgi:hypothetical protein